MDNATAFVDKLFDFRGPMAELVRSRDERIINAIREAFARKMDSDAFRVMGEDEINDTLDEVKEALV